MPFRLLIPLVFCCALAGAQVRPAVERIDAIVGHPLLVPVVVGERGPGATRVTLDDGQTPKAAYFRLGSVGVVDAGWLGEFSRYRATPAADAEGSSRAGLWYAVVDLPLDAVTQGLWFGAERYEVNWLPDPERAALEAEGRPLWASPVPPGARESPEVVAALDAVRADPFQRWRARLVRDGLTPTGGPDRTGAAGSDLDAVRDDLSTDPAGRFLDELARHHEARWQLILGRMALVDPEAAGRLRRTLGGVVRMNARWVPLWTPDSQELRALQADLLSPWVDDETRVLRALGWLDAQPKALAWVIDDAGEPGLGPADETRLTATLGVLSLPARDAPLLLEVGGAATDGAGPVLESAPARQAVEARAGVPLVQRRSAVVRTAEVPVRVGRVETGAAAMATIPVARPPGVPVGPLLNGWTMPALLAGATDLDALPARAASGVLRRTAPPGHGDERAGWSVYLECAAPDGTDDAVTLWTGPHRLPRGVWRIERDGTAHRLFGAADLAEVRVAPIPGGWALDATLPASAVDEDGVLRLGVTRETDGVTTSWPRRMTPGQDEPGRFPVDVTGWLGL